MGWQGVGLRVWCSFHFLVHSAYICPDIYVYLYIYMYIYTGTHIRVFTMYSVHMCTYLELLYNPFQLPKFGVWGFVLQVKV